MALLSIVLPAYNEEQNIARTAEVLAKEMQRLGTDYELVFISDGSADRTFEEICKAHEKDPHIVGAAFSRNFGKEAAVFAGLELATGDAVVVMDCDLQHPPSVIGEMLEKWKQGAQIVEGVKSDRGKEGPVHKMFAGLFYKIMSSLTKLDMKASSDYKLMDRSVVDVLLGLPEHSTFFRALTFWVGFRTEKVSYEVQDREFGESKWSTWSLLKYAVRNATSFSTMPLQIVTVLGGISILFGVVMTIQTMVKYLLHDSLEGFTTVILLILIIGGCIMLSLGIIGSYIARIYEEVKGRPRYIINDITENVPEEKRGAWKRRIG